MTKSITVKAKHARQAVAIAARRLGLAKGVRVAKNGVEYDKRHKQWRITFE